MVIVAVQVKYDHQSSYIHHLSPRDVPSFDTPTAIIGVHAHVGETTSLEIFRQEHPWKWHHYARISKITTENHCDMFLLQISTGPPETILSPLKFSNLAGLESGLCQASTVDFKDFNR